MILNRPACNPCMLFVFAVCATQLIWIDKGYCQSNEWHLQPVPNSWRNVPTGPLAPKDGYSWFRALVKVPDHWQGDAVWLFVEALDDARAALINGQVVGLNGTFPPQFRSGLGERGRFEVPDDILQFGLWNTVSIRVYQSDPRPNFSVAPPVLVNRTKMQAIRLEGAWQYRPGESTVWGKAELAEFKFDSAKAEASPEEAAAHGLFLRIDSVDDIERYAARREGDTDPLAPKVAESRFKTPEDLRAQLVLAEPDVAQPLFMTWDERGRMWVVEYRQYPDPAGLTMVSRDVFLRSVYDKVPPPPPHHFKGRDRITIHEDTDGDGIYDQHKTFVDELNLATSVAIGRGGVFITNPPYLLYYPDRDGDDRPDGDPEVLLEGFGLEDSHSLINSLRFGPDGWLYGAQGSTVSAVVRKPNSNEPSVKTLGQQIWRYHPERRIFEVYAEGGGNTFGCEIDSKGRVFSGHNGGDTRGFHYVQGGYYRKGFGKHGPLSNPYTFGFFENIKHHSVARFTHNFIVYEESQLPDAYRGKLFGIEPLQGQVVRSNIQPLQSSFATEDIDRVLKTEDPWFRPVDIKAGPDGCIYVADMYEQRIDHSSHYAGRIDRSNGRIYRLCPATGVNTSTKFNYSRYTSEQLIALLQHPDRWHRQTAIRLLGDRKDQALAGKISAMLKGSTGQTALELLWALHACEGLNASSGFETLNHSEPWVRAWTVRLLTDRGEVDERINNRYLELADTDPSIEVRKQLASSAKRMKANSAVPIIQRLLNRNEDASDIHQPLLVWWALEQHIPHVDVSSLLQALLARPNDWNRTMVADVILERWMKRYAVTGKREDLLSAAKLLSAAPDKKSIERLLKGFEEGTEGRSLASMPEEMIQAIDRSGGGSLALRLRQGQSDAIVDVLNQLRSTEIKLQLKQQWIEILGQLQSKTLISELLSLLPVLTDDALQASLLHSLESYDDPNVVQRVLGILPELGPEARLAAQSLLASRAASSRQTLQAILAATLDKGLIDITTVRKMLLHSDTMIEDMVHQIWGEVAGASSAEMLGEIARVQRLLNSGTGNPKQGKLQFTTHCGKCHRLFEEGGSIGPDLTPIARDQTERLLANIINPSLEIREGFENVVVSTNDGRVLTGFLADRDEQVIIVRSADGQSTVVPASDVAAIKAIPQSVMPEGTLKPLSDQQIRDLFAYLRSSQPVN